MNSRERIKAIINHQPTDHPCFWLGNPHPETLPIFHRYFKTKNEEELRLKIKDDIRWICPQFPPGFYRDPNGSSLFDNFFTTDLKHPLADCESIDDLDQFRWSNPDYLNFDDTIEILRNAGEFYRLSGMWTSFYHDLMFLFGMDNYLVKMYTHPEIIEKATQYVCNFYYETNKRFFERAGDLINGFFFGNDFGTQQDLIISPDLFDHFIMPWFRKFTDLGHTHSYQVVLHSCGAIYKVIDRLIDVGVDCLHPLQAKAINMNAEILGRDFKDKIAFMGGIDTQDLLVNATPEEVKDDIHRVKALLDGRNQFGAYEFFKGMDWIIYSNPRFVYRDKDLANWKKTDIDLGLDSDGTYQFKHIIKTPEGELSYGLGWNQFTAWITEFLIKSERDFDLWQKYIPLLEKVDWTPIIDIKNQIGDWGIVRGEFFGFGQGSPWQEFCLPYDRIQIEALHNAETKVVYHLCGGLMPLLETVVKNGTDGLETMTSISMGGDCDLAEANRRVGDRLFFIGGFDQNAGFEKGTPKTAAQLVRDCFEACPDSGYICSPSDHFFKGDPANIQAFVDEANRCVY